VTKVREKLLLSVSKAVIRPHGIRGRYTVVMKIVNYQLSGVSNASLVAFVGIEHYAC
jgi:hypothetical protein